ncbi:hypothetical protein GP486_005281 [Trichoglossum hirsutum]|uniref:Uncharacterized protein n=1 Tax=Trichoglossum hirsutum TaxID=265104 RepID=A0A9P8RMK1_9PEZI|nr:hypothetical protein GP486_005281 [Trichoglossum hirsutum]
MSGRILRALFSNRVLLLLTAVVLIIAIQAVVAEEERLLPVGELSVPEIEEKLQECPLVQSLNEHRRATAPQTSSLTSRIFAVLFPGSPAVNALLATLYISGPPSKFISPTPNVSSVPGAHL